MLNPSIDTRYVPIFPLELFTLPKGRQKLRLFEAKYISMLSKLSASMGFVIANPKREHLYPVERWGTLVKVVDFNMGEDGLLLIDVEGDCLVRLSNIERRDDELLYAQYQPIEHWPVEYFGDIPPELTDILRDLIDEHPHLSQLYPDAQLDNDQWVCARLLELLPIAIREKAQFTHPDSFPSLIAFLIDIFSPDDDDE